MICASLNLDFLIVRLLQKRTLIQIEGASRGQVSSNAAFADLILDRAS